MKFYVFDFEETPGDTIGFYAENKEEAIKIVKNAKWKDGKPRTISHITEYND